MILNTVQSAAVFAQHLREHGHDVLHLSSALCPKDRERVLAKVISRLDNAQYGDWTLVATSVVEAGVDLSFRTAFRERFSTTSLIQTGGRVNRHAEFGACQTAYDFTLQMGGGLSAHPAASIPAEILANLFSDGRLSGEVDAGAVVTTALRRELRRRRKAAWQALLDAERHVDYPEVARLARVIESDTRLVVVDAKLVRRLSERTTVPSHELLRGSVQLWTNRIASFALEAIEGRPDVYLWPYEYDGSFLGYMKGALPLVAITQGESIVI